MSAKLERRSLKRLSSDFMDIFKLDAGIPFDAIDFYGTDMSRLEKRSDAVTSMLRYRTLVLENIQKETERGQEIERTLPKVYPVLYNYNETPSEEKKGQNAFIPTIRMNTILGRLGIYANKPSITKDILLASNTKSLSIQIHSPNDEDSPNSAKSNTRVQVRTLVGNPVSVFRNHKIHDIMPIQNLSLDYEHNAELFDIEDIAGSNIKEVGKVNKEILSSVKQVSRNIYDCVSWGQSCTLEEALLKISDIQEIKRDMQYKLNVRKLEMSKVTNTKCPPPKNATQEEVQEEETEESDTSEDASEDGEGEKLPKHSHQTVVGKTNFVSAYDNYLEDKFNSKTNLSGDSSVNKDVPLEQLMTPVLKMILNESGRYRNILNDHPLVLDTDNINGLYHRPRPQLSNNTWHVIVGADNKIGKDELSGAMKIPQSAQTAPRITLLEHIEEFPPLLSPVGLGSKLKFYFRGKPSFPKNVELFFRESSYQKRLYKADPFISLLGMNTSIFAFENMLGMHPAWPHKLRNNIFLLIKTNINASVESGSPNLKNKQGSQNNNEAIQHFIIRPLPTAFTAGQVHPYVAFCDIGSNELSRYRKQRATQWAAHVISEYAAKKEYLTFDSLLEMAVHKFDMPKSPIKTILESFLKQEIVEVNGSRINAVFIPNTNLEELKNPNLPGLVVYETQQAYASYLKGWVDNIHLNAIIGEALMQPNTAKSCLMLKSITFWLRYVLNLSPWEQINFMKTARSSPPGNTRIKCVMYEHRDFHRIQSYKTKDKSETIPLNFNYRMGLQKITFILKNVKMAKGEITKANDGFGFNMARSKSARDKSKKGYKDSDATKASIGSDLRGLSKDDTRELINFLDNNKFTHDKWTNIKIIKKNICELFEKIKDIPDKYTMLIATKYWKQKSKRGFAPDEDEIVKTIFDNQMAYIRSENVKDMRDGNNLKKCMDFINRIKQDKFSQTTQNNTFSDFQSPRPFSSILSPNATALNSPRSLNGPTPFNDGSQMGDNQSVISHSEISIFSDLSGQTIGSQNTRTGGLFSGIGSVIGDNDTRSALARTQLPEDMASLKSPSSQLLTLGQGSKLRQMQSEQISDRKTIENFYSHELGPLKNLQDTFMHGRIKITRQGTHSVTYSEPERILGYQYINRELSEIRRYTNSVSTAVTNNGTIQQKSFIKSKNLKEKQTDEEKLLKTSHERPIKGKWGEEMNKKLSQYIDDLEQICKRNRKLVIFDYLLTPVSKKDMPEYYNYIKTPLTLGDMRQKCKKWKYKSVLEFFRDIYIICRNVYQFNYPSDSVDKSVYDGAGDDNVLFSADELWLYTLRFLAEQYKLCQQNRIEMSRSDIDSELYSQFGVYPSKVSVFELEYRQIVDSASASNPRALRNDINNYAKRFHELKELMQANICEDGIRSRQERAKELEAQAGRHRRG